MGRNVTLHIQNETGFDLAFVRNEIEHGKYNANPPKKISRCETGTFKVGNKTGAKVGPKGSITYQLIYTENIYVELTFYWDHPFSASASTYEVASNPPWFASYCLEPGSPVGHDQEVTYITRLNDYCFDPKEWMRQIAKSKANVKLRELFIPGSHDSGTYNINYYSALTLDYENWIIPLGSIVGASQGWAKAQNNSIIDQLNAGIRYFDLRFSNGIYATAPVTGARFTYIGPDDPIPMIGNPPRPVSNIVRKKVFLCHSFASVEPKTVFNDVKTFIDAHSKEIVFINIQHIYNFSHEDCQIFIQQLHDMLGDKMLQRPTNKTLDLTVKDVLANGKQIILFIDQVHTVNISGKAESGTDFNKTFSDIFESNKFIWSATEFLDNPYPNTCKVSELKTKMLNNISSDTNKFSVLQGIITPDTSFPAKEDIAYQNAITGRYPKTLEELGNEVSPKVIAWVNNEWFDKPINIVIIDWVCTSIMTQVCYMINKYHITENK